MARKIRNKPAIAVSGARKVHRDASLIIIACEGEKTEADPRMGLTDGGGVQPGGLRPGPLPVQVGHGKAQGQTGIADVRVAGALDQLHSGLPLPAGEEGKVGVAHGEPAEDLQPGPILQKGDGSLQIGDVKGGVQIVHGHASR